MKTGSDSIRLNKTLIYGSVAILLMLLFLDLNLFFHGYAKGHLDDDQSLFWLFAKDLADGIYHSPYLYGQDYLIPLESLFAVPLIKLGIPISNALPFVCMVLGILPFLILCWIWFKEGNYVSAFVSLSFPLLLPIEWNIITASPRGFIAGIGLVFLAMPLVQLSKNGLLKFIGYSAMMLAVLVNPNVVVVLIPFGMYHLMNHKVNFLCLVLALVPFTAGFMYLRNVKSVYSDQWVHLSWKLEWSMSYFQNSLSHFNSLFKGLSPFFFEAGVLLIVMLLTTVVLSWKYTTPRIKWLFVVFFAFFLFSLGINKVSDGTSSVFFPYARMYMGLPLVFLLFLSAVEASGRIHLSKVFMIVLLALSLTSFGLKQATDSARIQRAIKTNSQVVQVYGTKALITACGQLDSLMKSTNKSILLLYSMADAYCYGCAAISELSTVHPSYERRPWVTAKMQDISLHKALILDWEHKITADHPGMGIELIDGIPWPAYTTDDKEWLIKDLYP